MQPDTTLVLGDFIFSSFEIPREIPFGGEQRLAVKQLVGGQRIVDAMGRNDRAPEWSGIFMGKGAIDRARYLDSFRVDGIARGLTWGALSYLVIVREFHPDYRRQYEIPYRIVCEVVSDLTQPATQNPTPPIDAAIAGDMFTAQTLSGGIGDSSLSSLMGGLNAAISAVSTFAHATQSVIAGVLQPLAAVQSRVGILITSGNSTLANLTTFGGVLPGNPASRSAQALSQQVANVTQLNSLYGMRAAIGRMGGNLGAINASQNTVATAGGNLFSISQKQYGDASAWTGIAKANNLTDPFVSGPQTLTIPAQADNSGGVLSA